MKIHGYIVLNYMGGTYGLGRHGTKGERKVLWFDSPTLFPTYDAARCAIKRTLTYMRRYGYEWEIEKSARIARVL